MQVFSDPLALAQRSNRLFTTQTFQHNADFLFSWKLC
jgi:hypothetical protein